MADAATSHDRGPGIRVPPPLLFAAGFLIGGGLSSRWPVLTEWTPGFAEMFTGYLLVFVGLYVAVRGIATFRGAKTSVLPHRPASALVTHGVYSRTRNPIYLGMLLMYLGGTVLTHWWWTVAVLPLVLWALQVAVIRKEEAHLTERFPSEYPAYRSRVRRWL